MKFKTFGQSCFSSILLLTLLSASVFNIARADPTEPSTTSETTIKTNGDALEPSSQQWGIFSSIWAPFRATIARASQIFHSGFGVAQDRVEGMRERAFKVFMRAYNKTYSAEELPRRMALYLKRMQLIEESVKKFNDGTETFVMKPNRFLDWFDEEINMLSRASLPDELEPEELDDANSSINTTQFPTTITTPVPFNAATDANNAIETTEIDQDDDDDDDGRRRVVRDTSGQEDQGHFDEDDDGAFRVRAETVPARFSWRDSGCDATPIDQGVCGSCYAVSTMSAIETTRCIKQGSGATLSKQQIVDCGVRQGYNIHGCDGGWPTSVFKYLQKTRSVARESCYPYELANKQRAAACSLNRKVASQSDCKVNPSLQSNSAIKYKVLHNENDILYHVAKTGPVVTVLQTTDKLLYYGDGIILGDRNCKGGKNDVDHAITIVGYGSENGIDYWEIKNSWGTGWGDGGYAKIRRGRYTCSIGRWGWVMTG